MWASFNFIGHFSCHFCLEDKNALMWRTLKNLLNSFKLILYLKCFRFKRISKNLSWFSYLCIVVFYAKKARKKDNRQKKIIIKRQRIWYNHHKWGSNSGPLDLKLKGSFISRGFFSNTLMPSNDELILYFCDNKVLIGRKKMSKLCRCQKWTMKWTDKCVLSRYT